ncbi:putative glycosyltransferase [Tieghemostelium lacteum]|uniref:Putative glycosyltransferase n=1 Tax=Tieghemostelium lacteum TaxID=361077 RepID=A0A152A8E8_TIELA|nr:putative glycosyltransferase [Tieghemostelium lacteum]|eukprot:KYR02503.1 putative glycosyltransferase [Tieghemostelium lacteum]
MKIVMMCVGTRGDIQPSCVLGRELKNLGHQVRVITEKRLKYIVDQYHLEFWEINGDSCSVLFDTDNQKWLNQLSLEQLMIEKKKIDLSVSGRLDGFLEGAIGMDLIIANALTLSEGICISEKLNIPMMLLLLLPTLPTTSFPNLFFTKYNLYFKYLNGLTHSIVIDYLTKHEIERIGDWRTKNLELEPFSSDYIREYYVNRNQEIILAFDEVILPGEKVPDDYEKNWNVIGFLFPNETDYLPIEDRLLKFLRESPTPPITFGLGSMPVDEQTTRRILNILIKVCCKHLSQRLIILNNWSNFKICETVYKKYAEQFIILNDVDHCWLFKQCSLVIHHGGVGSTAAVLHSGVPSIVTWMYFDQPYWGYRIEQLGIGKSMKLHDITKESLLKAIKDILYTKSYHDKALLISEKIKQTKSNTTQLAIDVINKVVKNHYNSLTINEKKMA